MTMRWAYPFLGAAACLALILMAGCTKSSFLAEQGIENHDFQTAERALAAGQYAAAVTALEHLEAEDPFGVDAEQAQLDIIYAYYRNDNLPSALAATTRFIHLYPREPHIDYAYYMKGVIEFESVQTWTQRVFPLDIGEHDLTYLYQAFASFSQLLQKFPHSSYAQDARLRMVYIRNVLALSELRKAEFYWKQGAYVAAANRASTVVHNFQGAPAVIPALKLMILSYQKLRLNDLAHEAQQALQHLSATQKKSSNNTEKTTPKTIYKHRPTLASPPKTAAMVASKS